jgi:ribosome biogenesis protein MAK21
VFRIAIQALKLLYQFAKHQKRLTRGEVEVAKEDGEANSADTMADRFYRALYELLLRVHLTHKPASLDEFFALVFKSVKADKNPERSLAFVRRILQMATLNDSAYTAASLLIVSELIREKADLRFQLYSLE